MTSKPDFLPDRRALVAGVLASLCGGASLPVQAQPRFKAPVVDRLTLQVLIDNATFGPFLPNLTLPGWRFAVRPATGGPGCRARR
jgi:7,8-dihydropterin-6-yl-methyl-4-(beta-D-ribofuranosyl)aminobenzene 5'-phosphate synthase